MNLSLIDRLDIAEAWLASQGAEVREDGDESALFPVMHEFAPGLYIRTIHMPAGSVLTSKIHNQDHPFFILRGHCHVYSEQDGPLELRGPYHGHTKRHTRRILFVHEDTVWTTVHHNPRNYRNVVDVETYIYEQRRNLLLFAAGHTRESKEMIRE